MDDVLDFTAPNIPGEALSSWRRRLNYKNAKAQIKRDMLDHKAGKYAVFDVDRSLMARYQDSVVYDSIPPLRTCGPFYFIISLHNTTPADLDKDLPPCSVHRLITDPERLAFQGRASTDADGFNGVSMVRHAAGNAYAVPQLGSMIIPLMAVAILAKHPRLSEHELLNIISWTVCTDTIPRPILVEESEALVTCDIPQKKARFKKSLLRQVCDMDVDEEEKSTLIIEID